MDKDTITGEYRNSQVCSVRGCVKKVRARGFCSTHYARWSRHGTTDDISGTRLPNVCGVNDCSRAPSARWKGLPVCNMHYLRAYNNGSFSILDKKEKEWKYNYCIVEGCNKKPRSKVSKYCETHYYRIRRNGTLNTKVDVLKYANCQYCGKLLNGENKKFCSSKCRARKDRGNPLKRTCPVCGVLYEPNNKGIDKKVCSESCQRKRDEKIFKYWEGAPGEFDLYYKKIEWATYVEKNKDGLLITKCVYCGKKFLPSKKQIRCRIQALEGKTKGELNMYCSNACKIACPTYRMQKYYKGQRINSGREVPAEFRHIALEDRGYKCEKCGSEESGLHVHHIEGYTEQPMFRADLKNIIVVCKKCHNKIHKQDGCKYSDYKCDGMDR